MDLSSLIPIFVCICCIFLGMALVVQTLLNSSASVHFKVQIWGAVLSFSIAWFMLTILVVLEWYIWNRAPENEDKKKKLFVWLVRPKWYILLAGAIGVALLTAGLVVTYYVGSALFYVPLVVGQITCSAFVDHYGISLNGESKPFSFIKGVAIVFVFLGAGLSVYNQLAAELNQTQNVGLIVGCVLVSLFVGLIIPFQAVLNREAANLLSSRLQSVWWSFMEGTLLTLLILLVQLCLDPTVAKEFPARFADSKWYMYFGGCIGGVYVASALWFTGIIGFELYFVCLVSGQMAGSMVFDTVPLINAPARMNNSPEVRAEKVIGILLVVLGAVLIKVKMPAGLSECCSALCAKVTSDRKYVKVVAGRGDAGSSGSEQLETGHSSAGAGAAAGMDGGDMVQPFDLEAVETEGK